MSVIEFCIGLGQGGNRLCKVLSEEFEAPSCYLNLATIDFSQSGLPKSAILVFDEGGTGRNPEVGEKLALEYKPQIIKFLEKQFPELAKGNRVAICVGLGGGSGAGMLHTVTNWLLSKKADVLLIVTLPQKGESLPAQPNALKSLNKIIKSYLKTKKVSLLVIDNQFALERYGSDDEDSDENDYGNYWSKVNRGIVRSLARYRNLTDLEQYLNSVEVSSGIGSFDERELVRVLFHRGGFLDIREFYCSKLDLDLIKTAKFKSLVFGNLDIGTTKVYAVAVGFPYSMRNDPNVPIFLDSVYNKLAKITHTTFVLRSSHFNKKSKYIRVNILMNGLTQSKGLNKIIKYTAKDIEKYNSKEDIEQLDLGNIKFKG
jgi:hypothetical protein